MRIRPARESELPRLMELFDTARAYMRKNGNTVQWVNGYPSEDLIRQDIAQDRAFVVEEDGVVEAVSSPDATFLLGVQWHPEMSFRTSSESRRIAAAFVAAASGHGKA